VVARVVRQDGVLELVRADGRRVLPGAQVETLLSLRADLGPILLFLKYTKFWRTIIITLV
jgi:hypothetical protein